MLRTCFPFIIKLKPDSYMYSLLKIFCLCLYSMIFLLLQSEKTGVNRNELAENVSILNLNICRKLETELNKKKIIRYWVNSSDEDYATMLVLYNSKRYSWALFIGHLMIEKLLKAYFVQENGGYPPYIHNLLRLSEKAGLSINESQKVDLATITAFNINARYDDYKMGFQKKCTPDFTNRWIDKLNQLRSWIKKQIKTS